MIANNHFGMKKFELVETSERLMLAQVNRRTRDREWIAFLAWAPHPMNEKYDIVYLPGGDDFFGPNLGGSTVNTHIRAGFAQDCPNITALLENLEFNLEMEAVVMDMILNQFIPEDRAARRWMHNHPDFVSKWLDGVKHKSGDDLDAKKIAESMRLRIGG